MTGFEPAINALTGSTRVLKVTAPSRGVVLAQLERRMAGISLRAIKRLKRRHHELDGNDAPLQMPIASPYG